jgi:hypothetical protein
MLLGGAAVVAVTSVGLAATQSSQARAEATVTVYKTPT